MDLHTATPTEIDTKLAELLEAMATATQRQGHAVESLHQMAGDKKVGRGRLAYWEALDTECVVAVRDWLASGKRFAPHDKLMRTSRDQAEYVMTYFDAASAKIKELRPQIAELEDEFDRRGGWSRFILCLSPNGHIHRMTGCHTLRITSQLRWNPELSGKSEAEAVQVLGPILCTHCFATAPVEWTRDPKDVKAEAEKGLFCDGGQVKDADMRKMSPYGTCPTCKGVVSVTSTGKARKHKPTTDQ